MKKLIRYFLYVIVAAVVLLVLFIEVMTLLDYKPEPEIIIASNNAEAIKKDTITILSWNIGYAGLDAEMDFFYDGGHSTRTTRQQANKNLTAISDFLRQNDSVDVIFLQEIDQKARRSYRVNQLYTISQRLHSYIFYFAKDYDVYYVPVPVFNPMGRVVSGIAALSKIIPAECVRHAYAAQDKFVTRLFLLDNCFMSLRYRLDNGKELVLVNTHNSAYDDGLKRMKEMEDIKQFLVQEYNKGNYVIAGGDWNQTPPLFLSDTALNHQSTKNAMYAKYFTPLPIPADFMPEGWQWGSDGKATNRYLYEPYRQGQTAETLIDFFLVSPNVKIADVHTVNLNFEHSDHHPVIGQFVLSKKQ